MAAMSAVLSLGLGTLRPSHRSLSCFDSLRHQTSFLRCQSLISRNKRSPLNRILQACLQSNYANADALVSSSDERSEIVFMGTGTSEGIPRVSCLTNPLKTCSVCTKATEPGNKNRRLNTSVLVRYIRPSGTSNILIDCGKFFYHSALRWFPTFGLRTLDAVIITHSHADAIGGLDDLRDWTNNVQPHIPIYTAMRDLEVMKKTHYYLVDTSVIIPGAAVSELEFKIIHEDQPFVVNDLKITPLPVWHGSNYRSLGFRFGDVCYISDVSDIPEETYPLLKDCDLLIIDALRPDRSSATHFGLPRALEEVRKIKPKRTLFTGTIWNDALDGPREGERRTGETYGHRRPRCPIELRWSSCTNLNLTWFIHIFPGITGSVIPLIKILFFFVLSCNQFTKNPFFFVLSCNQFTKSPNKFSL